MSAAAPRAAPYPLMAPNYRSAPHLAMLGPTLEPIPVPAPGLVPGPDGLPHWRLEEETIRPAARLAWLGSYRGDKF